MEQKKTTKELGMTATGIIPVTAPMVPKGTMTKIYMRAQERTVQVQGLRAGISHHGWWRSESPPSVPTRHLRSTHPPYPGSIMHI